jgi:hypothetical protein
MASDACSRFIFLHKINGGDQYKLVLARSHTEIDPQPILIGVYSMGGMLPPEGDSGTYLPPKAFCSMACRNGMVFRCVG